MRFETPSRTSPIGGKRGCLCKNGKYSTKCCSGKLQAQGIGEQVTKYGLLRENGFVLFKEDGFKILL